MRHKFMCVKKSDISLSNDRDVGNMRKQNMAVAEV